MRWRDARQGGFTLVEVMVALTILSLVMMATVTALRTLANTQVAIERQTQRVDEMRSVSSFLRDALESAVVGQGGGSGGLSLGGSSQVDPHFRIFPDAVVWQSVVLFGESFGGTYLLRVGLEQDQLTLRWMETGGTSGAPDWGRAASRVLVSNLEEWQISYRRELADDWQSEWDSAGTPSLLRLQIKASGRYWPELIMWLRQ